jgi:HEAT repeat protein
MKLLIGWLAVLVALAAVAPAAPQGDKKDKKDKEKKGYDGLTALSHPDATVRYNSADLLAQLGPTAKFAVPALREVLEKEKSVPVRVKIVEALWKIEKSPASLLLPPLQQALKDKNPDNRVAAAGVLGMMGPAAKNAVPALSLALKDDDLSVRSEAATALGEIGPTAKDAVPALLATATQKDFDFIEPIIAITLGKIGPAAVPALTTALEGKGVGLRRTAATALGLIGPKAAAAAPALAAALADSEASVRQYAAQALGQIGPAAKGELPKLTPALKDRDGAVRVGTALALWQIDRRTEGVAVLTEVLGGKSGYLRERAARALGEIGAEAKAALPALAAALADKEAGVRAAAAEALGRLPTAKADIDRLAMLLDDAEVQVRLSAAQSLWTLAPAVRGRALPVLSKELTHKSPAVRRRAAEILGGCGGDARAAVPALVEALAEQIVEVRQAIAAALKKIDPDAAARAGVP